MAEDDFLLPLVDEPLGNVVAKVQAEEPEIAALVASPRRQLAFRTFAHLRVGIVLGQLLVERDIDPGCAHRWVEEVLGDPECYRAVAEEVRAVAREVATDPRLAEEEPAPDPNARERFRAFARKSLGS